jgi:DNA-binding response OmpR family regulator
MSVSSGASNLETLQEWWQFLRRAGSAGPSGEVAFLLLFRDTDVPPTAVPYQFGPFQLDPAEHRLLCNGVEVSLQLKAFEILCLLVENAGHLLGRIWPDAAVEENNLNKNVSSIARAAECILSK